MENNCYLMAYIGVLKIFLHCIDNIKILILVLRVWRDKESTLESGSPNWVPQRLCPRRVRDVQRGFGCQGRPRRHRDARPDDRRRLGLRQGTQEEQEQAAIEEDSQRLPITDHARWLWS